MPGPPIGSSGPVANSTRSRGWSFANPTDMRVLIITGSFPPDRCGVGDYTASLYRRLSVDPRVEVAVLTSVREPLEERVPDELAIFRTMRGWSLDQVGALIRVLRSW